MKRLAYLLLRPPLPFLFIFASFAPAQWVNFYGTQVRDAGGNLLSSGQICVQPVDGSNHPVIANLGAHTFNSTWTSGATSIQLPGGVWDGYNYRYGQIVTGTGIAAGTSITGSGGTPYTISLSTPTTAAATSATAVNVGGGAMITSQACTTVTNGVFGTANQAELAGFSAPDTSLTNPLNLCLRVTITDLNHPTRQPYVAPCVQPSTSATWCSPFTNGVYQCNYDLYSPALPAQALQQTGPTGPPGPTGATGATGATGPAGSISSSSSLTVGPTTAPNLVNIQDPTTGQSGVSTVTAAIQPQNKYTLNAVLTAIADMQSATGMAPVQLRFIQTGDSTTGFHANQANLYLSKKLGFAGCDPSCGLNSSTGTTTHNNGNATIVAGTGAPYDFTRSPTGIINNLASGATQVYGNSGTAVQGDTLKVYYLKEPTDGIYGASPGTMTITATSTTGACTSGCVVFTGSLYNSTTVGGVFKITEFQSNWTLTVAASGGAIDIFGAAIYSTSVSGLIQGTLGRYGMSLPDSLSTPSAVTTPWYASILGQPVQITSYTCTGTSCTFQTNTQTLTAGDTVIFGGLVTGSAMNGTKATVLSSGLSSSQFSATVSTATTRTVTEPGIALLSSSFALVTFEMKNNGSGTAGVGYPTCSQASTLNPTVAQTRSALLTQYISNWTTANPVTDLLYIASYDVNDACIPVYNDVARNMYGAQGYFYYDNYFPASYSKLEALGLLNASVHSTMNEQLAHSAGLIQAMGIDNFMTPVTRPVLTSSNAGSDFWFGTLNVSPSAVIAAASYLGSGGPFKHTYTGNNDGRIHNDVTGLEDWWDSGHANCTLYVATAGGLGAAPTCIVGIGYSTGLNLTGTASATNLLNETNSAAGVGAVFQSTYNSSAGGVNIYMDRGNVNANSVINYRTSASTKWQVGLNGSTDNHYGIYDNGSSTEVFKLFTGGAGTLTGAFTVPAIIPGTIYSAAGTALPSCASGIKGERAVVSDATSPTYMGAYASGGAITAEVICSYNGTTYSWLTH